MGFVMFEVTPKGKLSALQQTDRVGSKRAGVIRDFLASKEEIDSARIRFVNLPETH